jgi:hypothetical protein
VYQPQNNLQHLLPREPSLVLEPAPSRIARHIGGHIDNRRYHQVNHVITGRLGPREILLLAYDDGEVIAYYTRDIAKYVENITGLGADVQNDKSVPQTSRVPRQFFHENVGKSAWGLAIHSKSRLIGISSNRHEVTVFAFGLSSPSRRRRLQPSVVDYAEKSVRRRKRNWRIVIAFSMLTQNMPSITFLDNIEGHAEKICAVDIYGNGWIVDIWRVGTAPERLPNTSQRDSHPLGASWGVLAVPESSFIPTFGPLEFLGLPTSSISIIDNSSRINSLDITNSIQNVHNHPAPSSRAYAYHAFAPIQPASVGVNMGDEPEVGSPWGHESESTGSDGEDVGGTASTGEAEENDDEEDLQNNYGPDASTDNNDGDADGDGEGNEDGALDTSLSDEESAAMEVNSKPGDGLTPMAAPEGIYGHSQNGIEAEALQSAWLNMIFMPHAGRTYQSPTSFDMQLRFLVHREAERNSCGRKQDLPALQEIFQRYSLLRTYDTDIEITEPFRGAPNLLCRDPLNIRKMTPNQHLGGIPRLCLTAHIPELSLVIIGSQAGRVSLITLTRISPSLAAEFKLPGSGHIRRGFRVDWVLPTRAEEEAGRRPPRGLFGLAVSPIQERALAGGLRLRENGPSRRFRLILHYRNHSVLSYEIGRDDDTNLCIF